MSEPSTGAAPGATHALGAWVADFRLADYPPEGVETATHCLLDWLGCTIAGAEEPLAKILRAATDSSGNGGPASLLGASGALSPVEAARINGATSHALDFDDVHWSMFGHPTVPVMPAVLALGEAQGATGAEILEAFIAGYEVECRLGSAMGASHYGRGFHATGTFGAFGAAAACARLLNLDAEQAAHALAIAASRAAGLKSQFGTMVKPLHAGDAAASGLSAASLAAHGFEANLEAIETAQGFADTHADAFEADKIWDIPEGGFVRGTLFKYHAACYLTHSAIEAVRAFRAEGLAGDDVESMTIRVPKTHLKVCNIQDPATGLEAKFSLRQTAAMALAGISTGDPEIYTDAIAQDADLVALRDRIQVLAADVEDGLWSEVIVKARGQDPRTKDADTGVPALDLAIQAEALGEKFRALAVPRLGLERAERLETTARGVASLEAIGTLTELTQPIPA